MASPLQWSIDRLLLPLKYTWKISRNASDHKTNLLVTVTDGTCSGQGEAAPNIRYEETPDRLTGEFASCLPALPDSPLPLPDFEKVLDRLPLSRALRFAVESAYIHYLAEATRTPVEQILGVPPPTPAYISYTLPILPAEALQPFWSERNLARFRYIKLKVDAATATENVAAFCSFSRQPLMVDANEAFADPDACLQWMERIRGYPVEFVEQPLPAAMTVAAAYLKKHSPFTLMADESVIHHPDWETLTSAFHGINMKLMKAGGYLEGIRILREAARRGMKTMIGCMVETTLGISSAYRLTALAGYADLDSFLLLEKEPFGKLTEKSGQLVRPEDQ
jgi:L-alanine-DL-glutamate epimerase-like enolase superfamily enzyme